MKLCCVECVVAKDGFVAKSMLCDIATEGGLTLSAPSSFSVSLCGLPPTNQQNKSFFEHCRIKNRFGAGVFNGDALAVGWLMGQGVGWAGGFMRWARY